jgi:peptidoglycan hydrolase CwlO-like protein
MLSAISLSSSPPLATMNRVASVALVIAVVSCSLAPPAFITPALAPPPRRERIIPRPAQEIVQHPNSEVEAQRQVIENKLQSIQNEIGRVKTQYEKKKKNLDQRAIERDQDQTRQP